MLKAHYDKFRQINKYLELVAGCVDSLPKDRRIHIVDFGCGKSYLTFGLYYYLVRQLGLNVRIIGLDLKDDVIRFCEQVARDLGYDGLSFLTGDIQSYVSGEPIDMDGHSARLRRGNRCRHCSGHRLGLPYPAHCSLLPA